MKSLFILVCLAFVLCGCHMAATKDLTEIKADYASIEKGMTKEQVIARLKAPTRTEKDGALYWRREGPLLPGIDHDSCYYAELLVTFKEDGRVAKAITDAGVTTYPPSPH